MTNGRNETAGILLAGMLALAVFSASFGYAVRSSELFKSEVSFIEFNDPATLDVESMSATNVGRWQVKHMPWSRYNRFVRKLFGNVCKEPMWWAAG